MGVYGAGVVGLLEVSRRTTMVCTFLIASIISTHAQPPACYKGCVPKGVHHGRQQCCYMRGHLALRGCPSPSYWRCDISPNTTCYESGMCVPKGIKRGECCSGRSHTAILLCPEPSYTRCGGPPPPPRYKCDNATWTCSVDSHGAFNTSAKCGAGCIKPPPPPPRYKCDNGRGLAL